MRTVFEHWKYIFRNLWFLLPFAVLPAAFLALSVDFESVHTIGVRLFSGTLERDYLSTFRAWSFFRSDSAAGIVCSVLALIITIGSATLLLAFVEKHMRIGKRTLSGVFSQFGSHLLSVAGIIVLFLAIYEVWSVVLSAILFAVSAIKAKTLASVLFSLVSAVFMAVIVYLVTIFYLWLPCMQFTGFRAYEALLYSYRLMVGVRFKLFFSLALSYFPAVLFLLGVSFLPSVASVAMAFVLFLFLFLSFCVRMETLYFKTDKLDREDLLRSYKEL